MTIAYLCGPMEYAVNLGEDWREEAISLMFKLEILCISPNKEQQLIQKQEDLNYLKANDQQRYLQIMRKFISADLGFVKKADFLIVHWNGELSAGTMHEAGYAYQLGKPVYLVSPRNFEDIPGWLLGCSTKHFNNLNELSLFLEEELEIEKDYWNVWI
jgi:nucleoside 2-deoxyribosyltransferase